MHEAAVQIDAKGRLTIPRAVRDELGLQPGTYVFVRSEGGFGRFAKATNPFEELASVAVGEFREGRTRGLRELMREEEAGEAGTASG